MKKYLYTFVILAFAAVACEKEKIFNEDIIKDRPVTSLDVKYSFEDQQVKSLAFNSKPHSVVLHVEVNSPTLKWALKSNRSWCVVKNDGIGTSDINIEIAENESFDPRNKATLTFVAGDFTGFSITVDQTGSVFLLGQPFFMSSVKGGVFETVVNTPSDLDWSFQGSSWLSAEIIDQTVGEELTTSKIRITASSNDSVSRLGKLELVDASGTYSKGEIYISQFGTDVPVDGEGNILLPSTEDAGFSVIVPVRTVASVELPKFASYVVEEGAEPDTEIIKVSVAGNLSDCQQNREVPVSFILNNASSTEVEFPVINQEYIDAFGLMTAEGMMKFVQVANAGGDISGWMRDGVVTVLQDIDMSDIKTPWVSIGTESHPFSVPFNGGGFKITNIKISPNPVFGYCQGATISNLVIDGSCSFYANSAITSDTAFAPLARDIRNTTVTGCKVASDVALAGSNSSVCSVILGGMVGTADQSSKITRCDAEGGMSFSVAMNASSLAYVGGIVGKTEGEVSSCTSACKMEVSATAAALNVGAVTSVLAEGVKASNNSFLGSIDVTGNSSSANIGGLYGSVDGTRTMDYGSDKSASMGSIRLSGFTVAGIHAYVGGYIGKLEPEAALTINGYESTTAIELNCTTAVKAQTVNVGGIVGGNGMGSEGSLSASGLVNKGAITNPCDKAVAVNIKYTNLGGCVGCMSGNVTLKNCDNQAAVGLEQITDKSNSYSLILGGVIAMAGDGECVIEKCSNSGVLLNFPYNNNVWTAYTCNVSGGILGAYDYMTAASREANKTAKLTDCTVTAGQWGYRGICGGIVGFAAKAELTKCKCTGNMDGSKGPGGANTNNHAYVGGAVGVLEEGTVDNCSARVNIYAGSPGSEFAQTGGMVGIATGTAVISNCEYYGTITKSGTKAEEGAGGMIGVSTEDTTISNCKFGGSITGQKVSDMNVATLASGDGNAKVNSVTYWDGI